MQSGPRLAALAAVACVLLAGCAGVVDQPTPTGTSTTDATPAGNVGGTPTAVASETVASSTSPWGDRVVVGVAAPDDGRDYAGFVADATAYWEANDARYLGYEVDYAVRPDAGNPDLVVRFVDTLPACNRTHGDAVGCAPLITDSRQIHRPETVYVKTGLSDVSTTQVLKHELGHTLGLRHDDQPAHVMRASSILYTTPRPNATERDFPWGDDDFTVRFDAAGARNPDDARTQVRHALRYYQDGAPGMPTNLTFTLVDDPEADIVIRYGSCGSNAASCVQTRGGDPDGDGAIEEYTHLTITLDGVDTEAVGWHVGYWLAYGFGAEDDAEKPPPFRDASYRERRSEWWR